MAAREALLQRWEAGDAAAGDFIVGVLSTGIYCLPTCRARRPRPENVRFFATPEEARAAGLRACLRCRPDDHHAGIDRERDALERTLTVLRADPATFADSAAFAAAAGVGVTKLHALCRQHCHATPAALLARARVDHACRALAAGAPVAEAGFAAGFASLSTFHDRFRRATGLTPAAYRALGNGDAFVLALPAGYPLATLRTWGRDAQSLTDRFDGRTLLRAFPLPAARAAGEAAETTGALLVVELAAGLARCRVEASGPLPRGALHAAHAVAVRALGLPLDPFPFERRLAPHPELGRLVAGRRGLRVPLTADPFEALVWAVLGQQVNLPFAFALRRQLLALCGTPVARGMCAHPSPRAVAQLDEADLLRRQLSRRKAEYLLSLARAVSDGALPLDGLAGAAAGRLEAALLAQRGVGPWTAQYVMLRGYGLADCVPVGDAGLTLALQRFFALAERPDVAATRALMAPFAPFRSLATFHLWTSLGDQP